MQELVLELRVKTYMMPERVGRGKASRERKGSGGESQVATRGERGWAIGNSNSRNY